MRVDFLATAPQYAEHLRPIYDLLDEDEKGLWVTTKPARYLRAKKESLVPSGDIVVVSSYGDYKEVCHARFVVTATSATVIKLESPPVPVVLMEHGCGYTYKFNPRKPGWGGSYAGGPNRNHVSLFPSCNRWVSDANLKTYPKIPAPIVGDPKLDKLVKLKTPGDKTLAVSFHWDCNVWPETRTAFPHYWPVGLERLAAWAKSNDIQVIGHGHPRAQSTLRPYWKRLGWEMVTNFDEVVERADLYICDTSSTIFEFAALDRPVVLLDAPWYRRSAYHGIRFWDHADVGVRIVDPKGITAAVELALTDTPEQRELRHAAVNEVYPYLGHSATRTAEVLREFMEGLDG